MPKQKLYFCNNGITIGFVIESAYLKFHNGILKVKDSKIIDLMKKVNPDVPITDESGKVINTPPKPGTETTPK